MPGSSCSTSRRRRSTPRPSSSCSPGSAGWPRGRTAIYISHRFSTVRQADRILFLEHGRLVEEGTHDELMALGGRYARLFTLQAAAYTGEPVDLTAFETELETQAELDARAEKAAS